VKFYANAIKPAENLPDESITLAEMEK